MSWVIFPSRVPICFCFDLDDTCCFMIGKEEWPCSGQYWGAPSWKIWKMCSNVDVHVVIVYEIDLYAMVCLNGWKSTWTCWNIILVRWEAPILLTHCMVCLWWEIIALGVTMCVGVNVQSTQFWVIRLIICWRGVYTYIGLIYVGGVKDCAIGVKMNT